MYCLYSAIEKILLSPNNELSKNFFDEYQQSKDKVYIEVEKHI